MNATRRREHTTLARSSRILSAARRESAEEVLTPWIALSRASLSYLALSSKGTVQLADGQAYLGESLALQLHHREDAGSDQPLREDGRVQFQARLIYRRFGLGPHDRALHAVGINPSERLA